MPDKPPGNLVRRNLKEFWYWLKFACRIQDGLKEMIQEKRKLPELPNRTGEVAVITGGARGFGFEVVKKLLHSGFHVYIGDIESGDSVLEELKTCGLPTKNLEFLHLNLKSLQSVRAFAETILQKSSRVDLLFNNAGVMFAPYRKTEDGFEVHFQVNYLGHFLLANLLLPKMKETAKLKNSCCRIVLTSSRAAMLTKLDVNRIGMVDKVHSSYKAYNDSKLAQITYAKFLDAKLTEQGAGVRVYCVHPGVVPSKLWDNMARLSRALMNSFQKFYRTAEDGANALIYAALAPELEESGGLYMENCVTVKHNRQAEDRNLQEVLWQKSVEFTVWPNQ